MKRNTTEEIQGHQDKKAKVLALHEAVKSKNYAMVETLLERKINPNIQNENMDTPLHLADDDAKLIELLLKSGANPNLSNNFGKTPLHVLIDCLDEIHYDFNTSYISITPPFLYIVKDKLKAVELLLKYGANPNLPDSIGNPPLHTLLGTFNKYKLEAVEILLKYGANPNLSDSIGNPPLHILFDTEISPGAIEEDTHVIIGSIKGIIELLLKYGANLNLHGTKGYTLLHILGKFGHGHQFHYDECSALIKYLFENGANPNIGCLENSITPLHYIIIDGNYNTLQLHKLFKLFLSHGADPNLQNKHGISLLDAAINNRNIKIANTLLKAGADPSLLEDTPYNKKFKLSEVPPDPIKIKYPMIKSRTQQKFKTKLMIKNICKTIGLFNLVCKDGFGYDPYLPKDVVYLIGSFCSNVSPNGFAIFAEELKEVDANICSLKDKVNAAFSSWQAKQAKVKEITNSAATITER
ncbi:MAG: uncharacterized protein K0R73_397 [Candidatus Midichloriaceae bacterium]|jgi:ankyrin repeat protein|nr:uncharacterized protein [Candidatus Midichloriaceae bacterium]